MTRALWYQQLPERRLAPESLAAHSQPIDFQSPWQTRQYDKALQPQSESSETGRAKITAKDATNLFDQGYAQGRDDTLTEAAAQAIAMQHIFDTHLATARCEWSAAEGEKLAKSIFDTLDSHFTRLENDIAAVLNTWVMRALDSAAKLEITAQTQRILKQHKRMRVVVNGQQDLVEQFAKCFTDTGHEIVAKPSDAPGIHIKLPETTIETVDSELKAMLYGDAP